MRRIEPVYHKFDIVEDLLIRGDQRLLVFVNPAGGAGKAQRLVMEHVVGVWSEAELTYHMIITG